VWPAFFAGGAATQAAEPATAIITGTVAATLARTARLTFTYRL
jgi:hypothetical protein